MIVHVLFAASIKRQQLIHEHHKACQNRVSRWEADILHVHSRRWQYQNIKESVSIVAIKERKVNHIMKYNEDGTLSNESKKEIITAIEKYGYDKVSGAALWGSVGPSDLGKDMLESLGVSGAETNRDFTMVHMYAFEYKHNEKGNKS